MALGNVNVTDNGITPIERGGTGKTTASEALKALGGFSEKGGTIKGSVTIDGKVILGKEVQEGYKTTANGTASHAEGVNSIANGSFSHAEGWETTTSDEATSAHAEGYKTTVSGSYAHAEGKETIASGRYSHAEGWGSEASGNYAHAQGAFTEARAMHSFAAGEETLAAAENQFVIGNANIESTDKNDIFIIGNGITRNSASAMSNCLRVTKASGVYSNSTYHSTGADYAEYFQWKDRNSNNEDRVGLFVTLDGEEISIAKPNDDILGIVSACPSVCGETHEDQWRGMYQTDIYGRPILEEVTIPDEFIMLPDPQNPEKTIKTLIREAHTEIRQKLNENYDSTQQYIPRSKRPEWSAVGLLGKLVVIDDGMCEVNGWCTAGEGGIAVKSEQKTRFKVMARLDQNHIRVMML